ncbi:hypothetical protein [Sulfurimonas sp. CS5]|uniref:hypothetical protein n=1 Tax=Sulfurimonas sp. CS5 TaxID=3391145 RepID=UPI0039E9E59C
MEHRENMVLYNVLNQEVVFEEYFCNLLSIDEFREVFLKFIASKNGVLSNHSIEYRHFDTEVILHNNYGRADLFLNVDNKEFIFEIKNKDYTSLTENQPKGYLEYLKMDIENYNQHLFFLIPSTYSHRQEIFDRWIDFDAVENQIFYWEDLVKEIKNQNLQEKYVEIKMFYDFCEHWFNMRTIKFTGEEMELLKNINVPSLMNKLEDVTRKISLEVGLEEDAEIIGFCYTKKLGEYKIHFGIDYDIWKSKQLPLSILIQNLANNYQEFDLTLEGINLESMEYEESSVSDKQFGYVVMLNEEIGSDSYEAAVKNVLRNMIGQLKQT